MLGNWDDSEGRSALNQYLSERSYIIGFAPSQADNELYEILAKVPESDMAPHPHVLRWFRHISSFGIGRKAFPVVALPADLFPTNKSISTTATLDKVSSVGI